MGIKPAKVGHLLPTWPLAPSNVLKCPPDGGDFHKKVFTSQKGLRSTGGPDLLKWGLPGGGVKSAKVAPTPYVYYPPESQPHSRLRMPVHVGGRLASSGSPTHPSLGRLGAVPFTVRRSGAILRRNLPRTGAKYFPRSGEASLR